MSLARRSDKSSGDDVHDLVMELDNAQRSANESAIRLDRRLDEGGISERRQRTRSSPVPAMPDGPSSPSPHHHHHSAGSHRHTPEPSGSPHHVPVHAHPRTCPAQFERKEDAINSAPRPPKNYSAGSKRKGHGSVPKGLSQAVSGSLAGESKKAHSTLNEEPSELIMGDLFEINTRQHGGYDRKIVTAGTNSLRADLSISAFDGTQSLDGHRRKKREVRADGEPDLDEAKKRCHRIPEAASIAAKARVRDSGRNDHQITRYVLTGFQRKSGEQRAEQSIRSLGGEISGSEEFDPTCTHVICQYPVRTEKFMCAMASGKLLINSTYIDQSAQSGYFLPHEQYEWISIATSSRAIDKLPASAQELTRALVMWNECRLSQREHKEPKRRTRSVAEGLTSRRGGTCFSGFSAMLLVSNSGRDGMRRLLIAGGVALCADFREPYCGNGGQRFTHAFVSPDLFENDLDTVEQWGGESVRQQALQRLRELCRDGVRCLRAEFLLDFLAKGPTLACEPYLICVSDIKNARASRKRKRESPEQRWTFFDVEPYRSKKRPAPE